VPDAARLGLRALSGEIGTRLVLGTLTSFAALSSRVTLVVGVLHVHLAGLEGLKPNLAASLHAQKLGVLI
jgi:hypothetical protein